MASSHLTEESALCDFKCSYINNNLYNLPDVINIKRKFKIPLLLLKITKNLLPLTDVRILLFSGPFHLWAQHVKWKWAYLVICRYQ